MGSSTSTQVIGSVGLLSSGPLPVDELGRVYSLLYLSIETEQPTVHVEVAWLDLRDSSGARVASMVEAGALVVTGSGMERPFDGTVPVGGKVKLWSSMRLDAPLRELMKRRPTDFAGEVIISGVRLPVQGKIPPVGVTA